MAQRAYDGECIMGFNPIILSFENPTLPKRTIQFNSNIQVYADGASSISDTNGKLALACTGYGLYNRDGDSILGLGSDGLNPAKIKYDDQGWSNWNQNSIILPKGNDEYYVFTTTMSDSAWDDWDQAIRFRFDMLTYHEVDMKQNNGLGKVVKRNQILMKDAVLSHNRMSAVKHGNGRDWWLVKPHQTKHLFYLFLVTPDGITGPIEKSVNLPDIEGISGIVGQSTFNREGDKYAYVTWGTDGVFVLDFDRCTGGFKPYHFYSIPTRDSTLAYDFSSGTCFSPDGKLLYANTFNAIYQMELTDTSTNSVQFIHGADVPPDSLSKFVQYVNINIGADDRLYLNNANGVRHEISYIDKPNERGLACDFRARGLYTPLKNALGLPNMPWYHLGKKEGSVCDTIVPKTEYPNWGNIKIYPNPFSTVLNVYLPLSSNSSVSTTIYTTLGQRISNVQNSLDAKQEFSIDLSGLAVGVYFLYIESGGQVWREKIVKER